MTCRWRCRQQHYSQTRTGRNIYAVYTGLGTGYFIRILGFIPLCVIPVNGNILCN